ncbi:MAG: glycosyltransferase family 4 protein [Elusimicrobiota bacterium]
MRIGLDAQTLGRRRTGDETYWRNLLREFAALEADNSYRVYYTDPAAAPFLRSLPARMEARKMAVRTPFLRVPLAYAWEMMREPVDVFHTQYVGVPANGARLVLTVHDLSFEFYPQAFPWNRAMALRLTRWSARRADAVLAVSESTKRDLMRMYGVPEERVHVVPNAADPVFFPCRDAAEIRRVKTRYGLDGRYFIAVGALHPRKNLGRLLDAYQSLRSLPGFRHQLALVGEPAWGPALKRRAGVVFTGHVGPDDLRALYGGASALVYPSLYEGFGLPPLEAMACGAPAIVSNSSSLPEVCGDAAVYVDPMDAGDIRRAMLEVARGPDLRRAMRERGLRRAARFSWRETARKTLRVYESAAAREAVPAEAAPCPADLISCSEGGVR